MENVIELQSHYNAFSSGRVLIEPMKLVKQYREKTLILTTNQRIILKAISRGRQLKSTIEIIEALDIVFNRTNYDNMEEELRFWDWNHPG